MLAGVPSESSLVEQDEFRRAAPEEKGQEVVVGI
jgi:hypothetical protein